MIVDSASAVDSDVFGYVGRVDVRAEENKFPADFFLRFD